MTGLRNPTISFLYHYHLSQECYCRGTDNFYSITKISITLSY